MAQAGTSNRPLSPHLQIWRWGPHMAVSILHRVSGNGLAFVGLALLLWWLGALASGPAAYATFTGWVWADLSTLDWSGLGLVTSLIRLAFKVVLVGITWAFFTHAASGLRHFVLDIGAGYELNANRTWSILSPVLAVAMTAIFWALLLLR
ncbi:succinate dehydrogenase, cytochrome b556 subunit [Novosphingobium album (ex Liu et al. 2023)]|uniref:Succinate dehydrogenase cytochrome b556 subunit n=1 Tax=Novosphingobium album (ex Liu et al. 2023) TaxID=3031130 RepID=A0ABT5WJ83_9SPHN|nr:succinate dehydrogenase, cytochrome b556 subunit [Novosphingobium album (ex Liu et al. 2023)]MDE8650102.1 succinate dehydrogenase, cytochrome b556 subunit [Novosphingobium album (ex Liu et al. 2023)]